MLFKNSHSISVLPDGGSHMTEDMPSAITAAMTGETMVVEAVPNVEIDTLHPSVLLKSPRKRTNINVNYPLASPTNSQGSNGSQTTTTPASSSSAIQTTTIHIAPSVASTTSNPSPTASTSPVSPILVPESNVAAAGAQHVATPSSVASTVAVAPTTHDQVTPFIPSNAVASPTVTATTTPITTPIFTSRDGSATSSMKGTTLPISQPLFVTNFTPDEDSSEPRIILTTNDKTPEPLNSSSPSLNPTTTTNGSTTITKAQQPTEIELTKLPPSKPTTTTKVSTTASSTVTSSSSAPNPPASRPRTASRPGSEPPQRPLSPDSAARQRVEFVSVLLWCGAFMVYVSLGFFLTALVYNVWQEKENDSEGRTVDKIKGKEYLQYILLSIGCFIGALGAVGLTGRLFGAPFAKPWFKFAAVVTTAIQAALGYGATYTYPRPDTNEIPQARLGAGWEYADSAFEYSYIAIFFLVAHEISVRVVQRLRTKHHLVVAAAERLKQIKSDSPHDLHAKQAEVIVAQVRAEGRRKSVEDAQAALNKTKSSSLTGTDDGPVHSRPTAMTAGQDLHLQHLVDRLLHDKDRLTSAQLNVLFSLIIFFYIVQIGGLSYAAIEGWDLREGIQFSVVTVATIGYGDSVPRSTLGRALLFVYFPLGFGVMSYTISLLWTQLFTHAEEHFLHLSEFLSLYCLKPCRERRRRAAEEKLQRKKAELALAREKSRAGYQARKEAKAASTTVTIRMDNPDSPPPPYSGAVADLSLLPNPTPAPSTSPSLRSPGGHHIHVHSTPEEIAKIGAQEAAVLDEEEDEIFREEEAEFAKMEAALQAEGEGQKEETLEDSISKTNQKLFLAFVFVLFILLGGAGVFRYYQTEWTYFEAVYFCFCTLTTIGYGDFVPTLPETKIFVIYYVMAGLGALAYVLSLINEKITKKLELIKETHLDEEDESSQADHHSQSVHDLDRLKGMDKLPSWNERFLAANFEMERLQEVFAACVREKHAPSQATLTEFQTVSSTLASLALTVGQRQVDQPQQEREESTAISKIDGSSRVGVSGAGGVNPTDDTDDELDLSSYGIRPNAAAARFVAAHHVPMGKKSAKVVIPRTGTLAKRGPNTSGSSRDVNQPRSSKPAFSMGMQFAR